MKWYCTVCGYVYEGPEAPEACPVCKAPKEKFKQMDEDIGITGFTSQSTYC